MARYIDADKLAEMAESKADMLISGKEAFLCVAKWLKLLPSADVQEVKHGKWERSILANDFFRCSVCSAVWNRNFEYCPHCGAKMDGGNKYE